MTLAVTVDVRPSIRRVIGATELQLTEVNIGTVNDLLTFIERAQIKAYTQNASPSKPSGSRYTRTFKLQKSSKRFVGVVRAKSFNAEWRTDLNYAPFVIGRKSDQAGVHRNRWKPLEDVARETDRATPDIYEKNFKEVFR